MIRFLKEYSFTFIIPSIVLVGSYLLRLAAGPYWLCTNFDPSYQYLINGIYILKGIAPGHIDHPGTPLQLLCCLVIYLLNIGRAIPDVVNRVLIAPEFYLNFVNLVLIFLTFTTSIWLAAYTYQKSRNKILALLTQLPALCFMILKSFDSTDSILPVVANVMPETLLISIINLFNLGVLSLYYSKTSIDQTKAVIFISFICGMGVATKINFIPLLATPLMILPWKKKGVFFLIFLGAFVLWTLPIISRYKLLLEWVISLSTHTGVYGTGTHGFINLNSYLNNWVIILRQEWLFVLIAFFGLITGILNYSKRKANKDTIYLLGITAGIMLQFALVAKHLGVHYLLPGLAEEGLLFVFLYLNFSSLCTCFKSVTMGLVLLFVIISTSQAFSYESNLKDLTKDIYAFHEHVQTKYAGALFINYYRSSGKEGALNFGNSWRINQEGVQQELTSLYPNTYFFDIFGSQIANFKQRVWLDDLVPKAPAILFEGSPFDFSNLPYEVRLLEQGSHENVYLLTATTEKQANDLFTAAQQYFQNKDYTKALYLGLLAEKLHYCPTQAVDNFIHVMAFLKQQGTTER